MQFLSRRTFPFGWLILFACSHDVVYPDAPSEAVCGNGIVESSEACDVASRGCVACAVVPGWVCSGKSCSVICGDGVSGTGADCESPQKDAACDMTGYWAARETEFTRDEILGALQTSSAWYAYRFSQQGDAFQVESAISCGVHVSGSATVDFTPASLRTVVHANRMDPASDHGARKGVFHGDESGCTFSIDRWYQIRGATENLLPSDFSTKAELSQLPKMPSEVDPVNPTMADLAGAVDMDGDGLLGYAVYITGFVGGTRNSAERDYKEFATLPGKPVPAHAVDVIVPGAFDLEGHVLSVTDCADGCALIAAGAYTAKEVVPRITLHFLGKTLGSARVSSVFKGEPLADVEADLETCANVRLALHHETSQTQP